VTDHDSSRVYETTRSAAVERRPIAYPAPNERPATIEIPAVASAIVDKSGDDDDAGTSRRFLRREEPEDFEAVVDEDA
jgi:hypothetical protein